MFSGPAFAQDVPSIVTIKPSLGLTVSSSDITLDLDPATKPFDNKSITINIGTNNPTGYSLTLNSNGTDLVNINNSSETIPTLTESASQASFPAGRWGYRLGTDTTANYLPYISGTTIGSKGTITNNDQYNLTIASKIDYMNDAGSYKLDLDLKALPHVTQYYMQDLTSAQCTEEPTIVIDKRDEQIYTIRRFGNAGCWMIDNLRFGYNENNPDTTTLTLKPEDSNVTEERTITAYDLVTYGTSQKQCNGTLNDSTGVGAGMGYTTPCMHSKDATSGALGAWYNYAMVTANTINNAGDTVNTTEAAESICPKGWKLPSNTQNSSLVGDIGSNPINFNPTDGGYYYNNTLYGDWGYYWSSTAYNSQRRFGMHYRLGELKINSLGDTRRFNGVYARCILQE